jgi:hypothetical protein
MDRTGSFPKQDFEGMVCEIWSGLDICLYHAAYVRTYADSTAMRLAGSRRRETILQQMSQADRDFLQEDVLVFRAHFAGVLWQLHHLADELVRLAYTLRDYGSAARHQRPCSESSEAFLLDRCRCSIWEISDDRVPPFTGKYALSIHDFTGKSLFSAASTFSARARVSATSGASPSKSSGCLKSQSAGVKWSNSGVPGGKSLK